MEIICLLVTSVVLAIELMNATFHCVCYHGSDFFPSSFRSCNIINLKCRDILTHKNTFNMYQSNQISKQKKTTTLIELSFDSVCARVCVWIFFCFISISIPRLQGLSKERNRLRKKRNSSLVFMRVILCKIIDEKRVQVY